MKKWFVGIFIFILTFGCVAFAEESGFENVNLYYSDENDFLRVVGNLTLGSDRYVRLLVKDNGNNMKFQKVNMAGEKGEFIFLIDTKDFEKGNYTFDLYSEEYHYSVTAAKPFSGKTGKITYELQNSEVWMKSLREVGSEKNDVKIILKGTTVKKGLIDSSLYEITGLPRGLKATVVASDTKAIDISFYGKAESVVKEEKSVSIVFSEEIMTSENSAALTVDGIVILCSNEANKARYTADSLTFAMKNKKQPSDSQNSFIITPVRDLAKDGRLEKGTDFDYDDNLNGMTIEGLADKTSNTVKFTLNGTAKSDITTDFSVENFIIKSTLTKGAVSDSDTAVIKVIAAKGSGGNTSGGSTGGTSSSGASGWVTPGGGSDRSDVKISGGLSADHIKTVETSDKPYVPDKYVTFDDITNHWAKANIEKLAGKGIVNGVGNNMFMPNKTVTRAEFIKMIVQMLDYNEWTDECGFEDVRREDWFFRYVALAERKGLISKDKNFRPNDPISREEMTKAVVESILSENDRPAITMSKDVFADCADISEWAVEYVEIASTLGIVLGNDNAMFLPKNSSTRAEAVTIISRTMDYMER